jgi:hypothetical protein
MELHDSDEQTALQRQKFLPRFHIPAAMFLPVPLSGSQALAEI